MIHIKNLGSERPDVRPWAALDLASHTTLQLESVMQVGGASPSGTLRQELRDFRNRSLQLFAFSY